MLPKLTRMPDAELAAIASVCATCSALRSQQLRGCDGRAERADRAGRVEALLVVIRMDRLGDLALDLEAGQERLEQLLARHARALAERERGDERRYRRVREQAEDPVRARRELRVVPVERVAARAVDESCVRRARLERLRSEHGRVVPRVGAFDMRVHDLARGLRRAREQHAEPVDDAALRDRDGFGRESGEPRADDETNDRAGRGVLVRHRRERIAGRSRPRHVARVASSASHGARRRVVTCN